MFGKGKRRRNFKGHKHFFPTFFVGWVGGERWGQGQKKLEMGFGDLVEISMALNPSLIGLMEVNDPQLDHKAEGAHGQIFEFATTLKSISKQPNQSVHSEKIAHLNVKNLKPLVGVSKASGTQTNIDKIVPNLLEKRKEGPNITEFALEKKQKVLKGTIFGEITSNVISTETVNQSRREP